MLQDELNELVISAFVADVARKMNLSEDQEVKLAAYPDQLVKKAFEITRKKKLDNPFTYMYKIVSVEADKLKDQPKRTIIRESIRELVDVKPLVILVDPPKPWWSKSYDDNLVMFNNWYLEHGDKYANYYRKDKLFYSNRFMEELNRRFKDPDEVHRINNKAKEFESILMKYKPQSNTISENNKVDILVGEIVKKLT
jgi:hypothetical protein